MLRKMCGPKREKGTGDRRELHNEDLHNLYLAKTTVVIKCRRVR
jgi:hypothetical protein